MSTTSVVKPEPAVAPDDGLFVGRGAELERLAELCAADGVLVSLVGPPGVGKTRLARELMRQHAGEDVVWCDASELRSGDALLERLAELLGVSFEGRAPLVERVGDVVGERGRLLLALDNLEQMIESAVPVLLALRQTAPAARWLVTSREPLGMLGEWRLDIAPLAVEASGPEEPEAVRMLRDRITRARGAELAPPEHALLARIAARLDGLPLALELAASRIAALGAAAVEARLEQQLAVLTRGPRDLDRRQRTLREAIAWSWRLLTGAEQLALARLSVFRGGFELAAAEAVIATDDETRAQVLDLVSVLRGKSLLTARPDGAGAVRFGVYLSIRELAAGELSPEETAAAQARHLRYFAEWVERERDPDRLLVERDNLLVAIERALEAAVGEAMTQGARLLIGFAALIDRAPIEPYLEQLESFLASSASAEVPPSLRCRVQAATARCMRRLGRLREAKRLYADALALARAIDDRGSSALLHGELGMVAFFESRIADALAQWGAATELYRELGDERSLAQTQLRHGMILRECGRLLEARVVQGDALDRHRRRDDGDSIAISLTELALIHVELDELDDAERRLDEARRVHRRTLLADAAIFGRGAMLAWARGDAAAAHAFAERTLMTLGQVGYRRFEAGLHAYMGVWQLVAQHRGAAREHLGTARRLFAADPRGTHLCDAWLAYVDILEGNRDIAAQGFARLPPMPADDPTAVTSALLRLPLEVPAGEALRRAASALGRVTVAGTGRSAQDSSLDVRLALRALAELSPSLAAPRAPDAPPAAERRALVVAGDGARFSLDGHQQSLLRHPTLRKLLRRLVEARLDRPGAGLAWEALFAAGWPNERAHPEAARNRVKVAVSSLRSMGLREVIVHDGGGYLLDPGLAVRVQAS